MTEKEHKTTENIDYLHPEGTPAPASDSKSVELDQTAKRYLDSLKDQGREKEHQKQRRKNSTR